MTVNVPIDDIYDQLPPEPARVYETLGISFPLDVDVAFAAAVCTLSPSLAQEHLQTLSTAGLLEPAPTRPAAVLVRGRVYRVPDSVRAHARDHYARRTGAPAGEPLPDLRRRALDYYLHTSTAAEHTLTPTHCALEREYLHVPADPVDLAQEEAALAWLQAQRDNLLAAVRTADTAGLDAMVWQLAHALWPLLRATHDYPLWFETHERALGAARRCHNGAAETEILNTWGIGLRGYGRHTEAADIFDKVLHRAREARDERAIAQALHEIGATHADAGRPADAEPFLARARGIRLRLTRNSRTEAQQRTHRRSVAVTDVCRGPVLSALGRDAAAVRILTAARATLIEAGDRLDAMRALAALGRAHAAAGGLDAGEAAGRQAVEECDQAGWTRWQARSRDLLGLTLQDAGHYDEAGALFRAALSLYDPIDSHEADRVRRHLTTLSTIAPTTGGGDSIASSPDTT
ncbi:hypothetical protein OK074_5127 [Actinobacteria bacterium OK074]|nr:hypothetical protein OK074_5127 [Actinobacteria bacterium OK074]